jgi:hypothetical protein
MKEDEILFIDAKCKYKGKVYYLDEIVFKYQGSLQYWNYLELNKKRNILEPVQLYDVNIKARLGFANKTKTYRTAIKTEKEIRNVITGQYN